MSGLPRDLLSAVAHLAREEELEAERALRLPGGAVLGAAVAGALTVEDRARIAEQARRALGPPARRRRWAPLVLLSLPVLGAVAFLLAAWPLRREPAALALVIHVDQHRTGTRMRGEAAPGDRIVAVAEHPRIGALEIRLYRNDRELIASCAEAEPCQRVDGRVQAAFVLPHPGRYRVIVASGPGPLPPSLGSFDADQARLNVAGGTSTTSDVIEVW